MSRIAISTISRYLFEGRISGTGCLVTRRLALSRASPTCLCPRVQHRRVHSESIQPPTSVANPAISQARNRANGPPTRNRPDGKKAARKPKKHDQQTVSGWELTVGIEIHAQLNTARKLFSPAAAASAEPNVHVAPLDASMPGAQPVLERAVLVPALRAALALGCDVQRVSRFERKHYFWWDQPAGYQITQHLEPLARDGVVTLTRRDGIFTSDVDEGGEDSVDTSSVRVRIKQVQLEQDTGKTVSQPGGVQWIDLNRVGVALIEIVSEPDMRHPRTAAAYVRKVQAMLASVDACVAGMEVGGMRADVNVSVRRQLAGEEDESSHAGPQLGTRTEIKNLGSIKAVEDAIIAERDRQIRELEAGRPIAGETRGWTIGSKETRRLRGKEGEVDYRYMPDPDLPPLYIADDLVDRLRDSVVNTPDTEADMLISRYGLTPKDALSLMALEGGGRVEYFYRVVDRLGHLLSTDDDAGATTPPLKEYAALGANWILHELGKLTMEKGDEHNLLTMSADGECAEVAAADLAELLALLYRNRITGKVAKQLLVALYVGEVKEAGGSLRTTIDAHDLWFRELSENEYAALADEALDGQEKVVAEFRKAGDRYPQGKLMFLVGKMMRLGATERIRAQKAEEVLREKIARLCQSPT